MNENCPKCGYYHSPTRNTCPNLLCGRVTELEQENLAIKTCLFVLARAIEDGRISGIQAEILDVLNNKEMYGQRNN